MDRHLEVGLHGEIARRGEFCSFYAAIKALRSTLITALAVIYIGAPRSRNTYSLT